MLAAPLIRFSATLNLFEAGVEGFGDGIPEMQESIFLETDVHEHGIEAGFDIADDPLKNGAYDIVIVAAFDGVFFERAMLEESNAGF